MRKDISGTPAQKLEKEERQKGSHHDDLSREIHELHAKGNSTARRIGEMVVAVKKVIRQGTE